MAKTRKFRHTSVSWDTEAASYDVVIYDSGGALFSVDVTTILDDGSAEHDVKSFRGLDAANEYVNGLRSSKQEE